MDPFVVPEIIVTLPTVNVTMQPGAVTTTPMYIWFVMLAGTVAIALIIALVMAIVIGFHAHRRSNSGLEAALWGIVAFFLFPIGPALYLLYYILSKRKADSQPSSL
ncbi:MAG: hypothetical protein FWH51_05460 [Dehalococcoidia bacterium]|nr:hypothetical protein [Dehalococcoidia bacterium]